MASQSPPTPTHRRSYKSIPKPIQALLDEHNDSISTSSHCSTCRRPTTQRCSRCQVANYCSSACQKAVFAFHKGHCRKIKKLRDEIDNFREKFFPERENCQEGEQVSGQAKSHELKDRMELTVKMIHLADILIEIGYRESDTLENGKNYYQAALKYYLEPWQFLQKDEYFSILPNAFLNNRFIEDEIFLLFVLLGGDNRTIFSWCYTSGSPRVENYKALNDEDLDDIVKLERHGFDTYGLASDDATFHTMSLLGLMKCLAHHREKLGECADDKNVQLGRIDKISKDIQLFVDSFKYNNNIEYLINLRDTIPLRKEHAPKLFRGAIMPEFWMMLQDCFFEMRGINAILNSVLDE